MPNVPTTGGPDVQSEALPTPFQQAPPAGAFPFAAGAATEALGGEIGRIAAQERDLTHRTMSTAAVTQFQKTAMQARDSYLQLNGQDALAAFPKYQQQLEQARQSIAQSIPSRQAQNLFLDGSHSDFRIESSVIESHFAQQRKAVQANTLRDSVVVGTQDLASLASHSANLDLIDAKWEKLEATARQGAAQLGYSGEDADNFVARQMQAPAHAILQAMSDPKNGGDLQGALDKYGKYAPPQAVAGAQKALAIRGVNEAVHGVVSTAPLVNATGAADPEGTPDTAAVLKNLRETLDSDKYTDDQKDMIEKRVTSRLNLEKQIWSDKGAQLGAKVQAQALQGGGFNLDRVNAGDVESLRVTNPTLLKSFQRSDEVEKTRADSAERKLAATSSKNTLLQLEVSLSNLAQTDPQRFNGLKPTDLYAELSDKTKYPGDMTPEDMTKAAPALLKALQGQHQKDDLDWTVKAATQALKPIFPRYGQQGGGGEAALQREPVYGDLLSDLNEAVRSGDVKKGDPVAVKKFLDAKLAQVDPGTQFARGQSGTFQATIDARRRESQRIQAELSGAGPGAVDSIGKHPDRRKPAPEAELPIAPLDTGGAGTPPVDGDQP